jgi:hypothetical protein
MPEDREEDKEKVILTRYTPLGVVGAICPWYVSRLHSLPAQTIELIV